MWLTDRTNNIFDPFFDTFWGDSDEEKKLENFSPAANIVEKKDRYDLDVILPGVKKEDVNIEIKDNILTISGERKKEHQEEKDGYYHIESSYGKFSRAWNVEGVDSEKIQADYRDGVLKIQLPKLEEKVVTKKIAIK